MKTMIRTLSLATLSFFFSRSVSAADASAPVYQAVIRAELNAHESTLYTGGSLFMDGRSSTIELSLMPKMPPCAEGMMCAQVMPEPLSYEFENTTTEIDSCGIIRTRAVVDQRPVDGLYISVIVNNNRHNTCPTFVALKPLEVIVETRYQDRIKGEEVSSVETLSAEDFALIKPVNRAEQASIED